MIILVPFDMERSLDLATKSITISEIQELQDQLKAACDKIKTLTKKVEDLTIDLQITQDDLNYLQNY